MRRTVAILTALVLVCAFPWTSAFADGRAIVPGELRTDATYEHIGLVWWVTGDTDLDSALTLSFRHVGDSAWRQGATTWHPGAPAMRAYPTIRVQDGPLCLDYWGASAMFLQPGTTYALRATLTDPDGGSETRTVTVTTRAEFALPEGMRERYVEPGTGGGDGSLENPFRGLQAAADAAAPGDLFHVAPGVYTPFQLMTGGTADRPIVFSGPTAGGAAIVDGGNTDRGVVTVGEYDRTTGHVVIERLAIRNGRWGIDAQHTQDLLVRRCTITDVDYGILNRRGDGLEARQTVSDCIVEGRTAWPGSDIPAERGIDLRGSGNVVRHNRVRYFGDGVSVQPFTGASYGNDVHGNEVAYCVDDGIEIDYNQANARVWRNRVANARMGVSLQPIQGGPAYIVRNELVNIESEPIKMHNYTTGFIVAHNTGIKHGNGHGDAGSMWRNAIYRNNVFLGTRYAFEFTTVADEGFRDLDYGAWGTTRASTPHFKWDNVRYDRLADLPAGVEDHGVTAAFEHLRNAQLGADWDVAVVPGSVDLRLVAAAPERDAGLALPNLNDAFVLNGAPDMGAFEGDQALPQYGPRVEGPFHRLSLPLIMIT